MCKYFCQWFVGYFLTLNLQNVLMVMTSVILWFDSMDIKMRNWNLASQLYSIDTGQTVRMALYWWQRSVPKMGHFPRNTFNITYDKQKMFLLPVLYWQCIVYKHFYYVWLTTNYLSTYNSLPCHIGTPGVKICVNLQVLWTNIIRAGCVYKLK